MQRKENWLYRLVWLCSYLPAPKLRCQPATQLVKRDTREPGARCSSVAVLTARGKQLAAKLFG